MKISNLLLCCLILLGCGRLTAQVDVAFDEAFNNVANLSAADKTAIQDGIAQQLDAYKRLGSLINPATNKVDETSIQQFRELFVSWDSRVYNDAQEVPDVVSLRTYVDRVRTFLEMDGLSFDIRSANIIAVQPIYGSNGRYDVTVAVPKQVMNTYRPGGGSNSVTKFYMLNFNYRLKIDAASEAKIDYIRPEEGKAAERYTNILGLGLGGGLSLVNGSESALFNTAATSGSLEVSGGLQAQGGLYFLTNFFASKTSPTKQLFLNVGVEGFLTQVELSLNNYATEESLNLDVANTTNGTLNDLGTFTGSRQASNVNLVETQNLGGIHIPIGVAYQLLKKKQTQAFLSVQYAPGLLLFNSGSYDDAANGDYNFTFTVDGEVFNTADDNFYATNGNATTPFQEAYSVGEDLPITAEPSLETSFYHGVKFSALYLKDFLDNSSTLGVGLGLHYYLPLTSPWANDESVAAPFVFNNRSNFVDPGAITPFLTDGGLGYFGITLNIYTKNTRKP
ncbi:MAG: hypothetical protein AAF828_00635 [Bacteroidota bacterium]